MTLSRSNPRARARWLLLGGVTLTLMVAVAAVTLAVHDLDFQLDGDTSETAYSVPLGATLPYDWDSLFNADGTPTGVIDPDAATGFNGGSFDRDFETKLNRNDTCSLTSAGTIFCTRDSSTFATGSKDTLDITDWQCNRDNNVNSKIDIMNAYAVQYVDPSNGDRIMYFGLDKNKDNGNNNVAFWFLRGTADCESAGGAVDFTGAHQDGDVLVVSAFTNGGGVSNIDAYRWDGDDGCIDNPSDPAVCDGLAIGSGGDCKPNAGLDDICATTNSGQFQFSGNITTKWPTSDATLGVGTTVVPPDFFEGGINLTKVFASAGGVPSCFSTFIADTRSSQSLTATLFDFARGSIGSCETTLTTDAGVSDPPITGEVEPPASIGSGSVSSGTDTATLSIEGTSVWGGTLSWYLCGPIESGLCDNTQGVPVTSRTVSNTSPATDFVSGDATLTSAGRYCWTAHFEPDQATKDAGVSADDDDGVNECFTVAPVTPTLTTSASCSATPCVLGSTLSDTASLTGTATQPGSGGGGTPGIYTTINPTTSGADAGGTISWVLYAPSNGGCTDTRTTTPTSVTVDGDSPPAYGPVTYTTLTTDPIGTYTFVANYGGNLPNTTAPTTAATCAAPGNNETVTVVGTVSSATKQRWLPNDRIVLTSDSPMTGTLTATLYSGTFSGTAANCTAGTATPVAGQSYSFTLTNAASGSVFQTSNTDPATAPNTTFYVGTNPGGTAAGANGTYFWLIHVDTQLTDPADRCETTTITVTD